MKIRLSTRIFLGILSLLMLVGICTSIGIIENRGIVAKAYSKEFECNSTSYEYVSNDSSYITYTKDVTKLKFYIVGNYKATKLKGSNLSYYGSAKYTYNIKDNKTYMVLNLNPKAGKNATLNFSGVVTNNGKKTNFKFSLTCRLDFTYNHTLGVGFDQFNCSTGHKFSKKANPLTSVTSSNPKVVTIYNTGILTNYKIKAVGVGNATVKERWACGMVITYNYKVVQGKEYRSSIALSISHQEFHNRANKNIKLMYSDGSLIDVGLNPNGDYKRDYIISVAPKLDDPTKTGHNDVYIWYTDGTHSRITVYLTRSVNLSYSAN